MAKTPVGTPPETFAGAATSIRNGNGHATAAVAAGEELQTLLHRRSRDELVQLLSPQRKALYERIQGLRQAIGVSPFDIAESLRELREHA